MSNSLQNIPLRRIDGSASTLADYEGKVVLVVNVASKCGLTPQYEGLEKAFETYRDRGLMVLGFPSNEFAGQEPGTEAEIQSFCSLNYNVQFPLFAKVSVNGVERHPLYAAMIEAIPEATLSPEADMRAKLAQHGLAPKNNNDVIWNFEKFLIDRNGKVVGRFAPNVTVDEPMLASAIERALG